MWFNKIYSRSCVLYLTFFIFSAQMSSSFKFGLKAGANIVPTFIAIFVAVGLSAQVNEVSFMTTMWMTALVFSAPAQFAMMDVAAQGGVWLQVVLVGVLANLRFFIMSMTLAGFFRHVSRPRMIMWSQFVSASSYLITFFEARRKRGLDLFRFFQGVVLMGFSTALVGTLVGLWVGADMPLLLAFGAALFLPLYFSLLLFSEKMNRAETSAALIGLLATPPLEILLPGWGLIIAALGAGFVVAGAES